MGLRSCLHGGYGDHTLALLEVVDLLGKSGLRSAERIGLVPSVCGAHQLVSRLIDCIRRAQRKTCRAFVELANKWMMLAGDLR